MSGLVGYGSSDDEEEVPKPTQSANFKQTEAPKNIVKVSNGVNPNVPTEDVDMQDSGNSQLPEIGTQAPLNEEPLGPVAGPFVPPDDDGYGPAPISPYTITRDIIQNLTLPIVLNLDIPVSPPGSPVPGLEKKIESFLALKKQGVHFNEKLAKSSALKNPSLLGKMLHSAGLQDDEQYQTVLSKEVWDPTGFPDWAYKEDLAKAQKEREEELSKKQRDRIDFVSESGSDQASRASAIGSQRGTKGSGAERVMAGLNSDRHSSRRRSRSPRRRRSRSR